MPAQILHYQFGKHPDGTMRGKRKRRGMRHTGCLEVCACKDSSINVHKQKKFNTAFKQGYEVDDSMPAITVPSPVTNPTQKTNAEIIRAPCDNPRCSRISLPEVSRNIHYEQYETRRSGIMLFPSRMFWHCATVRPITPMLKPDGSRSLTMHTPGISL